MANTTADKLALLQATKADLKAALAEKGQTVGDVFSTYPAAVRAIETGMNIETVNITIQANSVATFYYFDPSTMSEENFFGNGMFQTVKNSGIVCDLAGQNIQSIPSDFTSYSLGMPAYKFRLIIAPTDGTIVLAPYEG